MRSILYSILRILTARIIRRYDPFVIGVTGSIGKTSAKDAIGSVLSPREHVRCTAKNYNNELGVPLTVIGLPSPGRDPVGWLRVIVRALRLLVRRDPDYPATLVLELGVDHPGDMDHLLKMVTPRIGVLTYVGTVHVEHFGTRDALRMEKAKLLDALPEDGVAIVNDDNPECRRSAKGLRAKTVTYGAGERAIVRAQEIRNSFERESGALRGVSFKLTHAGSFAPVLLPDVLGQSAVYAALAAAAVGLARGLNLVEIAAGLKRFVSPPGRLRVILGNKGTAILDDTYNAEPDSTKAALEVLRQLPPERGRKFAVLGDMLELGTYSESAHRDIGKTAAHAGLEALITVGERARGIAHGAREAGYPESAVFHFDDAVAAARFLEDRLRTGDTVLVKGSQGMRMEKAVVELMAEPLKAGELLVRQDAVWQDR